MNAKAGREKSRRLREQLRELQGYLNFRCGGLEIYLDFLASIAATETEVAEINKWKRDYDVAHFEKLRKSDKKRAAMQSLTLWRDARIYNEQARRAGQRINYKTIRVPLRIAFLAPFVRALDSLDVEFFEGLAEAVRILQDRELFSKDGKGDKLDEWLLIYKSRIWPDARSRERPGPHTARDVQNLVSNFRATHTREIRKRCRKFGIFLKPDARGTRAARYKRSNWTTVHRKKA